ncbi:helix-turn-helix domain-containing protein [Flavivirga aquimarina]|uniref:Helix-turn-helix domain-containing protein n=1 Tax=Flavivirga aquimarina TaxID=2027862 RepID=A0ABT8WEI6_9FLAO|nr:helix-turn-helix domain-containing protein [Flavivirga aquimarina]MDO5971412.1 helix-turn-helix domain-containing protein [Flavivirga aquimarina]
MDKNNSKIEQYHLHKAYPEKLQFQIYNLNSYRKKSGEKAAKAHSHSYYQIIWFFNEGGKHIVDFKTYDIKKNNIFFISKGSIHAFDNNLDVEGWLIHFNESFFMHNDVDMFLKYNIFSSLESPCHVIEQETIEIASSYIKLMENEMERKQLFGYEDIIRFSLKSFLIILERMHQGDKKRIKFNNHHELLFAKYKELVDENYVKNLTVSNYAAILNISSKTLTNITKEIVGKPASEIISERIILETQRLLKFTSLQISEIAYRVGFDDASYFVKYFKRHLGVSPSSYRTNVEL